MADVICLSEDDEDGKFKRPGDLHTDSSNPKRTKECQVTVLDSDEEDSGETSHHLLEKNVLVPIRKSLAVLASSKKSKLAAAKKSAHASYSDGGWAKGTGFGGSTTTTVQAKKKTAAETAAEKAQVKADGALATCAVSIARSLSEPLAKLIPTPSSSSLAAEESAPSSSVSESPSPTKISGKDLVANGRILTPVLDALVEGEGGVLLDLLGSFLRSLDSLMEASARSEVLRGSCNLISAISVYPPLVLFLITPIDKEERDDLKAPGSLPITSSSSSCSSSSSSATAAAPPATVSSLLAQIDAQAGTFMALHESSTSKDSSTQSRTAAAMKRQKKSAGGAWVAGAGGGGETSESVDSVALCAMLRECHRVASAAVEASRRSGVLTPALLRARRKARQRNPHLFKDEDVLVLDDSKAEASAAYVAALKPLRFEAISLLDMIKARQASHAFSASALQSSGAAASAKKRMMRLASEVASLQSNLPVEVGSSVFARADESRLDILKVLIVGPAGTPYENGCFEFDVWLPASYPEAPPKVQLITTGSGTVRFNPNLYNCGKVCLSLLGTWQGPGWDPVRSTFLQVLISIQSLIMVEEPFFNEPGFQAMLGTSQGDRASQGYNATVREATLRFGIAEQLERPSPVFKDVVNKHFKLKGAEIQDQLRRWCTEAGSSTAGIPGGGAGYPGTATSMRQVAERVRSLLLGGMGGADGSGGGSEKRPISL